MSELMDIVTRYADSDKTKDAPDEEDDKGGKGKKNDGKGHQNNNKRKNGEGISDLVANTNSGFKSQRPNINFKGQSQGFSPNNYRDALKAPCPRHSRNGRPANHSCEDCFIMQKLKNGDSDGHNNGANGGGHHGNPGAGNQGADYHGSGNQGAGNQGAGYQGADSSGQHQGGTSGFQSNPKQLSGGQYHVFTTSTSRREKKLKQRAVNAIASSVPRWLNWSE